MERRYEPKDPSFPSFLLPLPPFPFTIVHYPAELARYRHPPESKSKGDAGLRAKQIMSMGRALVSSEGGLRSMANNIECLLEQINGLIARAIDLARHLQEDNLFQGETYSRCLL